MGTQGDQVDSILSATRASSLNRVREDNAVGVVFPGRLFVAGLALAACTLYAKSVGFAAASVLAGYRKDSALASVRLAGVDALRQKCTVPRAAGLTVAELTQRLRERGLNKSPKIGSILAEFVKRLEEAMEEEEDADGGEGLLAMAESVEASSTGESSEADPRNLLAKLKQLDPRVQEPDYFDAESGEWDLEGLRDDLDIALAGAEAAASDEANHGEQPEALLEQLMRYDKAVMKEDYYDSEMNVWDMDGLRDDLELSLQRNSQGALEGQLEVSPAATKGQLEASPAATGLNPEDLWAQLRKHDPKVEREDYYDSDTQEWDVHGLEDDLKLAVEAVEGLFARLASLDPNVSKNDYFESETGTWDTQGLQDDLELASRDQSGAAIDEQQEAAAAPAKASAAPPATLPAAPPATPSAAPVQPAKENAIAAAALAVGTCVLAKWTNGEWYTGVVVKADGDCGFVVKWDEDNEESVVARDFIQVLPPLAAGAVVRAVWEQDGKWYDAVVQKDNGDGTFVVKYDVDDSEASLKAENIRSKLDPPKELKYWCAPFKKGDLPPQEGERVMALWKNPEAGYEGFHGAVVQKDRGDGTFQLKWEEDDTEGAVKREDIRTNMPRCALSDLKVGQKLVGVITRTANFGAFVDIGSENDGLVHISRIAEGRVVNVDDVVSEGQAVDVWICGVDDGKITLSMVESKVHGGGGGGRRTVDLSPFTKVDPNQWLTGKVSNIASFGAFVEVTPPNGGLAQQGLVHVKQIKDGYVEDVAAEVRVGQEVKVRVVSVDLATNKLSLSMKNP